MMLRCGYANVAQVLLFESNQWKLENMKKEPNDTHILSKFSLLTWPSPCYAKDTITHVC
jgi:hypothetical protein